jgi:hypothetical protein
MLAGIINKQTFDGLIRRSSARDNLLRQSYCVPGASAWLEAVPCGEFGLVLSNQEIGLLLRYRLCLPVFGSTADAPLRVCPQCKKRVLDAMGDHAQGCSSGIRTVRHNALGRKLAWFGKTLAKVEVSLEESDLVFGSQERPADVLFRGFGRNGSDLVVDVTVRSTVGANCKKVGDAAWHGVVTKERKYEGKIPSHCSFMPLCSGDHGCVGW